MTIMTTFLFIILVCLCFIMGMQFSREDIKLIYRNYNFRINYVQIVSYVIIVVGLGLFLFDCFQNGIISTLLCGAVSFFFSVPAVWLIAKVNSRSIGITIVEIGCVLLTMEVIAVILSGLSYIMPFIFGVYYRNNPFGSPFIKNFLIFSHVCHPVFTSRKKLIGQYCDVDFSYAGLGDYQYRCSNSYNVLDYGILPNSNEDSLTKLQALIDKVGMDGGGKIFFPKGKYYFNRNSRNRHFLSVNYSHIHLCGEIDENGKPLAKLINCNHTLTKDKNPWLSPFFITTGEKIQRSNIFWGVQFLKKKNIVTKSNSMSDPGSDGTILTPQYITDIIADSSKGSDIIKVKDTFCLRGIKYIMLALFNTTSDGNLIKDILGVDELRPEWKTALRAGEEQAPSYQWIIEIDTIFDNNTIQLKRPLLRDLYVKYTPKVYAVEMLEDIKITDLCISSRWNGIFRHHGFRRYYSMIQAQEMDYGWNAINMKRVAHGLIRNVIIEQFTNPLYIMDSRNIEISDCIIQGADGHQGIKLYEHTCDCLIKNVIFHNHYADMLGGEGNAYGNVFDNISYCTPYFKPVDFDFHGFSEGPMSPPSHNLFINIYGFRNIKGAGADYNQPACAQHNMWVNCERIGNLKGEPIFENIHYLCGSKALPREHHSILFKNSILQDITEPFS